MQNGTDDQIAVPIIEATQKRFSDFTSCSFDKGFHNPRHQEELAAILDKVILPKKGKLSAINKEVEESEEFIQARHKHSDVEFSINALENHGRPLLDHGIKGCMPDKHRSYFILIYLFPARAVFYKLNSPLVVLFTEHNK